MPTWFEHVDLLSALVTILFMAVIWFMIRTLQGIDKNQREMFNRLNSIEKDFYTLSGEHKAQHNGGSR